MNLSTVLLWFMERGLFLAAHKPELFAKEVTVCQRGQMERQAILKDGRQTRPSARAWTGEDAKTRDDGRDDEVSAGAELDAFVTSSHGGSCGAAVRVNGESIEGNEPNEKCRVAAGSNGCLLDAGAGGNPGQLPRDVDERG